MFIQADKGSRKLLEAMDIDDFMLGANVLQAAILR